MSETESVRDGGASCAALRVGPACVTFQLRSARARVDQIIPRVLMYHTTPDNRAHVCVAHTVVRLAYLFGKTRQTIR